MSTARQADAATVSLLVLAWLGALLPALPWFLTFIPDFWRTDWGYPIAGFDTWIGVLVCVLDVAIVVAMALHRLQFAWALAASALLCLAIAMCERLCSGRDVRDIVALRLEWGTLGWALAAPIAANALLLVLGWRLRARPVAAAV